MHSTGLIFPAGINPIAFGSELAVLKALDKQQWTNAF